MHDCNEKRKVRNTHTLVSRILRTVQKIFQRSDGNGWIVPKMHDVTKMTEFVKLFGSGINFYGGPGELHHKYFVKALGDLTQRRVSKFVKQVANRVYETMAFDVANKGVRYSRFKEGRTRYMAPRLIWGENSLTPGLESHKNFDLTQIFKLFPPRVFLAVIFDQLFQKWTFFVAQGPGY